MTSQQSLDIARDTRSRASGFTLIELLLSVAIAGTVLGVAALLLQTTFEARAKAAAVMEVEAQGTQVLDRLTQLIRNADSITTPAAGTSSLSLTLDVVDGTKDPTVISVTGPTLQIAEGSGSAVALTTSRVQLANFTVTNLTRPGTPGSVRIQFTLSATNPGGRSEFSFSKSFTAGASLR